MTSFQRTKCFASWKLRVRRCARHGWFTTGGRHHSLLPFPFLCPCHWFMEEQSVRKDVNGGCVLMGLILSLFESIYWRMCAFIETTGWTHSKSIYGCTDVRTSQLTAINKSWCSQLICFLIASPSQLYLTRNWRDVITRGLGAGIYSVRHFFDFTTSCRRLNWVGC